MAKNEKVTMLIDGSDNVAVAIENIEKGENAKVGTELITANDFIKTGHKIARRPIKAGEMIIKYGTVIGKASADIKVGDWVHSHNVEDITEQLQAQQMAEYFERAKKAEPIDIRPVKQKPVLSRETIMGYPRSSGRFGIRNNVLVISLIQCSNGASNKIAAACSVPALTLEGGCLEFQSRKKRMELGFTSAGTHPNTYAVLLVSLGCQQTNPNDIVAVIEKAGRKVRHLCVQEDGGYAKVVEEGIKWVNEMKAEAATMPRVPCPISELVLAGYNGGSDWTSGLVGNVVIGEVLDMHEANDGIIMAGVGRGGHAEKGATYEVAGQLTEIGEKFRADCQRREGIGLSQVNPTPGNKAGGLTTLTEKNLGSSKTGGHSKLKGIVPVGEPAPGTGAWGINQVQGNNDSYACTTLGMGGVHIILFGTGKGTPVGNAGSVVLKTTGNKHTYETLSEMIDYCSAPVMWGEKTMDQSSQELYELVLDMAEGKLSKAEILGDYSWTVPHGTSLNGDN